MSINTGLLETRKEPRVTAAKPRRESTNPLRDISPPDPYYGIRRGHVHVSQISGVDPSYQRDIEPSHVNKLNANWRQELSDPVLLAEREDSSLWIVKGHHRYQVHVQKGLEWVYVTIIPSEGAKEEADWFYVDATGVRLLRRMDKYRANTTRENPSTVAMNECLAEHGFKISSSSGTNTIAAVGRVEYVWSLGGSELLGQVLDIIGSVWAVSDKARDGEVIAGLGVFLRSYQDDPNYDRKRLMAVLSEYLPTTVMALAIEASIDRGGGTQGNGRITLFARQLRDLYNKKNPRRRLATLQNPSGRKYPGQAA